MFEDVTCYQDVECFFYTFCVVICAAYVVDVHDRSIITTIRLRHRLELFRSKTVEKFYSGFGTVNGWSTVSTNFKYTAREFGVAVENATTEVRQISKMLVVGSEESGCGISIRHSSKIYPLGPKQGAAFPRRIATGSSLLRCISVRNASGAYTALRIWSGFFPTLAAPKYVSTLATVFFRTSTPTSTCQPNSKNFAAMVEQCLPILNEYRAGLHPVASLFVTTIVVVEVSTSIMAWGSEVYTVHSYDSSLVHSGKGI